MTRPQLSRALNLALTDTDLSREDISQFWLFGTKDYTQRFVTIRQVARLIRWQCVMFNGSVDSKALDEVAQVARRKFIVV